MSTLNNLVDETTNIKNELVECRDTLKQILIEKNIKNLENEVKLSTLINKVELIESKLPSLYIYNVGDECTNVSGGWKGVNWDSSKPDGYFAKASTYLEYGNDTSKFGAGGFITNNLIDLTPYKRLVVKHQTASGSRSPVATVCLSTVSKPDVGVSGQITNLTRISNSLTTIETIINIENYNGSFYLGVYSSGGTYASDKHKSRLHYLYLED